MNKDTKTRREERVKTIKKIATGGGLTDYSLKNSIVVINSVIEDLTESIEKSSKSSSRLAIIVAICTAILAIIGIIDLCVRLFNVGTNCL